MKRLLLALLVLVPLLFAAPAHAATGCHTPTPAAPYIDVVRDGNGVIGGAGQVSACSGSVTSAKVTVSLQHSENGTWVTRASDTVSRGWPSAYRYAKQTGTVVYTGCIPGDWRVDVVATWTGGGAEFNGPTATFKLLDSGVCGAYGGGD